MPPPSRRRVTPQILAAALAARRAKCEARRAEPDTFGLPAVFVVRAGANAFAWELRRFCGIVLRRGSKAFPSQAEARADGVAALTACPHAQTMTFADRRRAEPEPLGSGEVQRGPRMSSLPQGRRTQP